MFRTKMLFIIFDTLRAVIFAARNFRGTTFAVGRSKNCEFRGINFRDWVTLSVQNLACLKFGDWQISDFWRGFNLAIQNIG